MHVVILSDREEAESQYHNLWQGKACVDIITIQFRSLTRLLAMVPIKSINLIGFNNLI